MILDRSNLIKNIKRFWKTRKPYTLSNEDDDRDSSINSILDENNSVVSKENEGVKMFVYFFESTYLMYLITHPIIEKIKDFDETSYECEFMSASKDRLRDQQQFISD